jgi:hypothetical protein
LAPYTPCGGGCQRFTEPVLSPLLYNSNLLSVKGIFEDAKIRKSAYLSACFQMDFIMDSFIIYFVENQIVMILSDVESNFRKSCLVYQNDKIIFLQQR